MSLTSAVDNLLAPQPEPPAPIGLNGENFTSAAYDQNNDPAYRNYLKAWWIALMIKQGISITEKMTLFWHNHFATELTDIQDSRYAYYQNKLFRQTALGNFKALVKAVTIDPAMLRYLNGNTNTRLRPNENYARELQELFTIGKGPEVSQGNYTNYTEQDVQAAARVLTGWMDVRGSEIPRSQFVPNNHDTGEKQFSAAYQNSVIRTTFVNGVPDGSKELDDLLDMIFSQPETARYISRKLYRWFVYYEIDSNVEQNVIEPMANIFRSSNYEIRPVLDALFKSAHFYDPMNMGCFIRTPVDFVVGAVRQLSPAVPDMTNLSAVVYNNTSNYNILNRFRDTCSSLLMNLFDPPDVAGWKAFYQIPDFYELWINATTLPTRGSFTDGLISGRDASNRTFPYRIDPIAYARTMSSPDDPVKLVDDLAHELSPIPLTQKQKEYLLYNVMNLPQTALYNWTEQWNAYLQNPNNTTARTYVTNTLTNLLKFMLRLAEAQLA
jgi:uncharacterized protein (DUF1800 family)